MIQKKGRCDQRDFECSDLRTHRNGCPLQALLLLPIMIVPSRCQGQVGTRRTPSAALRGTHAAYILCSNAQDARAHPHICIAFSHFSALVCTCTHYAPTELNHSITCKQAPAPPVRPRAQRCLAPSAYSGVPLRLPPSPQPPRPLPPPQLAWRHRQPLPLQLLCPGRSAGNPCP